MLGTGTLRIIRDCKANGFAEPIWRETDNGIVLEFPGLGIGEGVKDYMEAQKNDTVFHLSNGFSIRIRKGIDTVEELLPEKHFIRVHRSFIVAERLAYRREKRSEILLRGVAHSIPVGPKYQDEVDRLFLK